MNLLIAQAFGLDDNRSIMRPPGIEEVFDLDAQFSRFGLGRLALSASLRLRHDLLVPISSRHKAPPFEFIENLFRLATTRNTKCIASALD